MEVGLNISLTIYDIFKDTLAFNSLTEQEFLITLNYLIQLVTEQ